jgi:hypothetical protein
MRVPIGLAVIMGIVVAGIPAIMAWENNSIMRDVVIPGLGFGKANRWYPEFLVCFDCGEYITRPVWDTPPGQRLPVGLSQCFRVLGRQDPPDTLQETCLVHVLYLRVPDLLPENCTT